LYRDLGRLRWHLCCLAEEASLGERRRVRRKRHRDRRRCERLGAAIVALSTQCRRSLSLSLSFFRFLPPSG